MQDVTGVESHDGNTYVVEFDTETEIVSFFDEEYVPIAYFSLATLATITGGLWLDLGAGLFIDPTAMAGVKDFCRI
jgi:hypothetical protein